MKKIILCYFLPFSLFKELKTSPYMDFLIDILKKFESIFLVNTENLISAKIKAKMFYRIHENSININPKNYKTNYLGFNQKRKSSDIIFKYIMENTINKNEIYYFNN